MKKILIANSLTPLVKKVRDVLLRDNIKIFSAPSEKEIVNTHRAENVDLIVMELDSGMNGDGVCSIIRKDNSLNKVSIILICDKNKSAISRVHACEANAYITKPVNSEELLRIIKKFLHAPERKDFRALLRVLVKGESKGNSFFANSKDISRSGILFETDKIIEIGEKVKCSFFLESKQITTNGKIVRTEQKAPDLHNYGVMFLECDPVFNILIEKFVEKFKKRL